MLIINRSYAYLENKTKLRNMLNFKIKLNTNSLRRIHDHFEITCITIQTVYFPVKLIIFNLLILV